MGPTFVRRFMGDGSGEQIIAQRFDSYYPRAFAYVLSNVGNPGRARDLVTEAFARVLAAGPQASDEDFRLALFRAAQDLCRKQARAVQLDFGLTASEREVTTLLFDAQLSPAEASSVCGEKRLTFVLHSAIEKLRNAAAAPEIPYFYRAL